MTSLSQILVRSLAVGQSMKRALADAETRKRNAERDLESLRSIVNLLESDLGICEAQSMVSDAANRVNNLSPAIYCLRQRADKSTTMLSDIRSAFKLSEAVPPEAFVEHATTIADQAEALDALRNLMRPRTNSVESFAKYINGNADNSAQIRRYLGLPVDKKAN